MPEPLEEERVEEEVMVPLPERQPLLRPDEMAPLEMREPVFEDTAPLLVRDPLVTNPDDTPLKILDTKLLN